MGINYICNISNSVNSTNEDKCFLPNEIWSSIMEKLEPEKLLELMTVSKEFHMLVNDDRLWSQIAANQNMNCTSGLSPKQEFICLHHLGMTTLMRWTFMKDVAKRMGPRMFLETQKNSALFFHRNALNFPCNEGITIKLLKSRDPEIIKIYYSGLGNFPALNGQPRVTDVPISMLSDYIFKLMQRESCGVLNQQGEFNSHNKVTLKNFSSDGRKL